MKQFLFSLLCVMLGIQLFSCTDTKIVGDGLSGFLDQDYSDTTLVINFAVVRSSDDKLEDEIQRDIAKWVEENWNKSCDEEHVRIKVNTLWYDADSLEQAGEFEKFALQLANTDSIAAVIALASLEFQQDLAEALVITLKPLIIPYGADEEFIRNYADVENNNIWVLGETNAIQAEVLMDICSKDDCDDVAYIGYNDDYGDGLLGRLGYIAYEQDIWLRDIFGYVDRDFLKHAVRECVEDSVEEIILSLKDFDDNVVVLDEYNEILKERTSLKMRETPRVSKEFAQQDALESMPRLLFGERAVSDEFIDTDLGFISEKMSGIRLVGDPTTGFVSAYRARYGKDPSIASYFYDAYHLIIYASVCKSLSKRYADCDLNSIIRQMTNESESGWNKEDYYRCAWYPGMLEEKLWYSLWTELDLAVSGASGTLVSRSLPSVGYSTFERWTLYKNKYTACEMYSRNPRCAGYTISPVAKSDMKKTKEEYDEWLGEMNYVDNADERWAVIVAPVTGYSNYRFVSSAYAFYHYLKDECHYDDDHILFITDTLVATSKENFKPNSLFMRIGGNNYYTGNEKVDYAAGDITLGDFKKLMAGGEVRGKTPFRPDRDDNVLVMWFGHGTEKGLAWNAASQHSSAEVLDKESAAELVAMLVPNGNRTYNKMFWFVEACYSASVMSTFEGMPGMLMLTSASDSEMSRAVNPFANAWLANQCTLQLYMELKKPSNSTMYELYRNVYDNTLSSHPTLLNDDYYGNITKMWTSDFFKK